MAKSDKLKDLVKLYRHDGAARFRLASFPTDADGGFDKDAGNKLIKANRERLEELQRKLYAQKSWSLLLIFQGLDAAGKDSAIESVFDGVNPQGCEVSSFKQPSTLELDHDYLWRSTLRLPRRGMIGIFNRSYYEECLVVRVHKAVLENQRLPKQLVTPKIWRERFEDISAMERHLARNGTVVLKFFLHLSKDEQRNRFLSRLDEPSKNWKFEMSDVIERQYWDKYQEAYEDMIDHTSTPDAPWYVIPADRKWYARVMIGSVIVSALERLKLTFPKSDPVLAKEFGAIREALINEGKPGAGSELRKALETGDGKAAKPGKGVEGSDAAAAIKPVRRVVRRAAKSPAPDHAAPRPAAKSRARKVIVRSKSAVVPEKPARSSAPRKAAKGPDLAAPALPVSKAGNGARPAAGGHPEVKG